MLWAYLGPQPAPLVPDWDLSRGRTASCRSSSPRCPATGSSARRTASTRCTSSGCTATGRASLKRRASRGADAPRVGFDEFEYGFIYRRIREDTTEDDRCGPSAASACGRTRCSPATTSSGACRSTTTNTLSVGWYFNTRAAGEGALRPGEDPLLVLADRGGPEDGPLDRHARDEPGLHRLGGPGRRSPTATQEHLGESDRGIIMMRKQMLEQAQLVADGGEPKAVIRDPERNKNLPIRSAERNETATGHIEAGARDLTGLLQDQNANADGGADFLRGSGGKAPRNRHLSGQPQWILDEMDALWAERLAKLEPAKA